MKNLRLEVIKYAKMLNSKKLSALRSGNISVRCKNGFLVTPSGTKYYSLKSKAMNLAFDITPAKYVTGLITEKGVCEASTDALQKMFK